MVSTYAPRLASIRAGGQPSKPAAKIAGIVPPVIVTDVDPKLAVHRSNNQNRDATPGQKAMATAMAFPKGNPGKRNDLKPLDLKSEGCDFSEKTLSRARYVLRNNPIAEGKDYPQRCLDIMAGSFFRMKRARLITALLIPSLFPFGNNETDPIPLFVSGYIIA